jgi:hypothetical protein
MTVFSDTRIAIRNLATHADGDRAVCHQDNFVYKYDTDNTTPDDDETYLKPYNAHIGRWVREKEYQLVNL